MCDDYDAYFRHYIFYLSEPSYRLMKKLVNDALEINIMQMSNEAQEGEKTSGLYDHVNNLKKLKQELLIAGE